MKAYTYASCSSCRDATKWLRSKGVAFEEIAIRETPPSETELRAMLTAMGNDLRRLFNTSGLDYRALGLKDQLPTMKADEAIKLLRSNGNLVKRPFVIDGAKGVHLVGFKATEWEQVLG